MSKKAMQLALERLQARTDTADLDAIAALNEALEKVKNREALIEQLDSIKKQKLQPKTVLTEESPYKAIEQHKQEILAEREDCARIAESEPRVWDADAPDPQNRIAAKIRARGNP